MVVDVGTFLVYAWLAALHAMSGMLVAHGGNVSLTSVHALVLIGVASCEPPNFGSGGALPWGSVYNFGNDRTPITESGNHYCRLPRPPLSCICLHSLFVVGATYSMRILQGSKLCPETGV